MPGSEKKVLVYQAYGKKEIFQQTAFSITSVLQYLGSEKNIEIWIYTDSAKYFTEFFGEEEIIKVIALPEEKFQSWRGDIDFTHRVKVEILKLAANQFVGPIFYCDSDTHFIRDPRPLLSLVNDRTSLMHLSEGTLDQGKDPLSKKILKFCRNNQFDIHGEQVSIGPSTVMWNAGFMGISQSNKDIIEKALELTDRMYRVYQKHVMEQLAFSFFLQTRTQIEPSNLYVEHYWDQKPVFLSAIQEFLETAPSLSQAKEKIGYFKRPSLKPAKKAGGFFKILRGKN